MDNEDKKYNIPEDRSVVGLIAESAWKESRPTELLGNIGASSKINSADIDGMQPFLTSQVFMTVTGKISPSTGYAETLGKPCNKSFKLSDLKGKGFTLCGAVHMTGFTNATSEEIAEIESLLLSGVIL